MQDSSTMSCFWSFSMNLSGNYCLNTMNHHISCEDDFHNCMVYDLVQMVHTTFCDRKTDGFTKHILLTHLVQTHEYARCKSEAKNKSGTVPAQSHSFLLHFKIFTAFTDISGQPLSALLFPSGQLLSGFLNP